MAITEIRARFMRRVQVKDYEPMEAEISAVWSSDDPEDAVPKANQLLIEVKEVVMAGLRHKCDANPNTVEVDGDLVSVETVAAAAREPGKPSPGHKRRTKVEIAEDAARDVDPSPDPAGDVTPEVTADPVDDLDDLGPESTLPETTPSVDDLDDLIPEEIVTPETDMSEFDVPEENTPTLSDSDLLKVATAGAKALDGDVVRKLIAGFDVVQLQQLSDDQRKAFARTVNDAIKIKAAKI